MGAFLGLLLVFWVCKSAVDKGRKEYRATREHHATQIARDHKDWHPRRVHRAASRRALSYWWGEVNAWPPFPSFRAAFAEDRLHAKVEAAEAKASGVTRWKDLKARLEAAEKAGWPDAAPEAPPAPAEAGRPSAPGDVAGWQVPAPPEIPVVRAPGVRLDRRPSSWLKPGQPPCEACEGTGANQAGNDSCPACRGFGSAPADPAAPEASPGTICAACGNPGRPGDPVLADTGGPIHRTHAEEMQEAYREALKTDPRMPPGEADVVDDAAVAADHGFEGEFDLFPEPEDPETWPPPRAVPDPAAPSPAANGTSPKGTAMTETTIDTALEGADTPHEAMQGAFRAFGAQAARIAEQAADDLAAAAAVHGMDRDPQTAADIQALSDHASALQAQANAAATGLASRHADGAEYHASGVDADASAYRPA